MREKPRSSSILTRGSLLVTALCVIIVFFSSHHLYLGLSNYR